jgi:hypothetical protein
VATAQKENRCKYDNRYRQRREPALAGVSNVAEELHKDPHATVRWPPETDVGPTSTDYGEGSHHVQSEATPLAGSRRVPETNT